MTRFFVLLLILSAFCAFSFGQNYTQTKISNSANSKFLPLSELKEGMKGTARTVFRGSVAEEFNVEILGVVPSAIGPNRDLIIGKISGGGADRTAVFAGMSGSPVYIDGKLVGAISYSFPFSKEPICGITPIEQMLEIFEQKQTNKTTSTEPRSFSFGELAATTWKPNYPNGSIVQSSILAGGNPNSALGGVIGQTFQPIATPLAFSGFSQEALNQFAPQMMSVGLMPVASAGGGSKITPLAKFDENTLRGGASVSMSLVRGDYSMAAAGTVTYRDGEKIYAFGHPFLNLGSSDLPMSESSVVVVVPSLNNSFKLSVPNAMVGTMTQDRSTGVYGKLGQAPKMIPVKLNMQTSRGQSETVNFEVAKDDFLTPLLLNISVYNAILANERSIGESTIEVSGEIKLKTGDTVKIERRFSGPSAALFSAGSVAIPTSALLKSRFDEMEISQITLNLSSTDGSKTAVLERATVDKAEIKAGETFEVQAFVRSDSGKVFVQKIPVKIPADTPAGTLLINVADGATAQQVAVSQHFVPKNLGDLVKTINGLKKEDRLYVQTYRITNGAVIGSKELPNLPPSVLATLNNERTAGAYKPTIMTVWTDQEIPPAEFIISGQQVLTIEVIK
ncbi:MAG TPA: SpoIVB peptidase S55 domain-containing protein [Pyrinomonadaceae bacterium]|nr:SpoIVB peptidase S55 domain-containing protein [Pyrinomonadaceae bacterium]